MSRALAVTYDRLGDSLRRSARRLLALTLVLLGETLWTVYDDRSVLPAVLAGGTVIAALTSCKASYAAAKCRALADLERGEVR